MMIETSNSRGQTGGEGGKRPGSQAFGMDDDATHGQLSVWRHI
jgi:hypothetical protein